MSREASLIADVAAIAGARVLSVGDVILDRFVYGGVERISPEGPIPVLRVERQLEMLGGGGNVARNLSALGAETRFVGVVGDDEAGRRIEKLLGDLTNTESTLITEPKRRTGIKTRYIAGNQQMMRADDETVAPLPAAAREALLEAVKAGIGGVGAVVLSDYGKGVLAGGVTGEIIALARGAGVPVIVDPQGKDYAAYAGADLVTPNRKELGDAAGAAVDGDEAIVGAAQSLIAAHGLRGILVTRSADGMTLVRNGAEARHFPARAREVFDVSGAGDTVAAAIAAATAAGLALDHAAELANVAAGIVVGKVGTAVAYASDVIAALHDRERMDRDAKIVAQDSSLAPVLDRVERWRAQGLKVGFTNGCFDLLHPGHLAVLTQAKAACDRLIVGLNSDASTSRLKGPSRPVQGEAARAAVLASLECVDLVILFEDDTPAKLIEAVKPEVFVKGADYRVEDIPEARLVEAYGGVVVLAELAEGHSTTATIARMTN